MSDAPLILTLKLDPVSFERLDGLRRAHFPPALNHIPAHLTLFHKLPAERLEEVVGYLTTSVPAGPLQLQAIGLRKLGRGTAFEIAGAELKSFRGRLAHRWADVLSPQDAQGFRPHVTVQNKVEPIAARALYEQLGDGFQPFDLQGVGVLVWRYLGGPWRLEAEVGFTPPT